MRTAGLPNFRKLWGRLPDGIKAGDYTLTVKGNYDVKTFDGEKAIIIANENSIGGK